MTLSLYEEPDLRQDALELELDARSAKRREELVLAESLAQRAIGLYKQSGDYLSAIVLADFFNYQNIVLSLEQLYSLSKLSDKPSQPVNSLETVVLYSIQ